MCIEPDPELYKKIRQQRKWDICINAGIGIEGENNADFYVMSSKTLNTFSRKEAEGYESNKNYGNQKIVEVIKIPLVTMEDVVKKYDFHEVDFVTIDTEGLDFDILKSFDSKIFRPKILCVETARSVSPRKIEKDHRIQELMEERGYFLYADTFINSIFIDEEFWMKRYEKIH